MTYNARMKPPKRLQSLIEEGLIDTVVLQLMSGKEAAVYVVRCGEDTLCAKVYKEATHRSFRQAVDYTENRRTKNSRQARAMAKEIAARNPDVLIASPMARTMETAGEIANLTGLEIKSDKKWIECGFGEWDELTVEEIMRLYPEQWQGWISDTAFVPGKTGESYEALAARTAHALSEIEEDYVGKTIAIVTHHMVIKTLLANALSAPLLSIFHLDIPACGISTIHSWPSDGLRAVKSLGERSFI